MIVAIITQIVTNNKYIATCLQLIACLMFIKFQVLATEHS